MRPQAKFLHVSPKKSGSEFEHVRTWAGKDVHWLLGLDGAVSWDPYIEDSGIEFSANEGTTYSIIMSSDHFQNSPHLHSYDIATCNFYFCASDYVRTLLLQTISY